MNPPQQTEKKNKKQVESQCKPIASIVNNSDIQLRMADYAIFSGDQIYQNLYVYESF